VDAEFKGVSLPDVVFEMFLLEFIGSFGDFIQSGSDGRGVGELFINHLDHVLHAVVGEPFGESIESFTEPFEAAVVGELVFHG
jgi:hypothetical protein